MICFTGIRAETGVILITKSHRSDCILASLEWTERNITQAQEWKDVMGGYYPKNMQTVIS